MTECEEAHKLLNDLYALIESHDTDVILPLLTSAATAIAAQHGVPREFFTKYFLESIDDAYKLFTRNENEAVH